MMINTTCGQIDESELTKKEVQLPDGMFATEYYMGEELVHRSVEVRLSGVSAATHFMDSASAEAPREEDTK